MLKDRGTIKWTSLMLPEHVELLKEMWNETEKVNKPMLDPQEQELINDQLIQAYDQKLQIIVSFYKDGFIEETRGIIRALDTNQNKVSLQTKNDLKKHLDFDHIISVTITG